MMTEDGVKRIELKYGCNPNQKPAALYMSDSSALPVEVLNGRPGYINFMDALNGWQLVSELSTALGREAAASFKHVSPTSAAVGEAMSDELKRACFVDDMEGLDDSPLALAYARARGTDRLSSFGDWISLSENCDEITARLISREVSDGIIAPGYDEKALEILKRKKKGNYNIIKIDRSYVPASKETKQVFGITFEQGRNDAVIGRALLSNIVTKNTYLPEEAKRDLIVALITLKYTQSNSVCYATDGQAVGVGAGQQSRIHCTRLAGDKADLWQLRQHEKVLSLPFISGIGRPEKDNAVDLYLSDESEELIKQGALDALLSRRPEPFTKTEKKAYLASLSGVSIASDAFFPFPDNIERAARSGVSFVAQPGGSLRDELVTEACDRLNLTMVFTGLRLFHH